MHTANRHRIHSTTALILTAFLTAQTLNLPAPAIADTPAGVQTQTDGTQLFTGESNDGAHVDIPYVIDAGQSVELNGSGWHTVDGSAGSTVVVKLYYTLADGESGIYTRTGDAVVNHPRNGNPDPTIWAVLTADDDGSFHTTLDLPTELTPGQKFNVAVTSGLAGADDIQRSVVLGPLAVGGEEWVEPENPDAITCVPSTPKPTVKVSPKPNPDGTLTISGTGFCHSTDGGSRLSIKIDDGRFKHVPGHQVHDNATIWAIHDADPRTGDFTVDIVLPDGTDQGQYGSDPIFESGSHLIRILTGTLKDGDPIRSIPRRGDDSTTFTVGEYRPSGVPEPLDYESTLTTANQKGVSFTTTPSLVTVTIPESEPGDWVFASTYIEDSSVRLPWRDNWYTVGEDHRISLPLGDRDDLPEGRLKLVIQSGNAGKYSDLVGWNWITLRKPDTTDPGDPTDPVYPDESVVPRDLIFAIAPLIGTIGGLNGKLGEIYRIIKKLQPETTTTKDPAPGTVTRNTSPVTPWDSDATQRDGTSNAKDTDQETVVTVIKRRRGTPGATGTGSGTRVSRSGRNTVVDRPRPDGEPTPPVLNAANLTSRRIGPVTSSINGDLMTLAAGGHEPGEWVYLFNYSPKPTGIGWAQLDDLSQVALDISGLGAGEHRIAMTDSSGKLIGWSPVPDTEHRSPDSAPVTATEEPPQSTQANGARATGVAQPLMSGTDWALILGAIALVQLLVLGAVLRRRRRQH
ncbi:hypothetical protein M0E84_07575 [Corynebacterium sp. CCM 9186]|uniref:hypothetical protein n=1 Tax=Corynebacterium meridianum TaxID=2765363 RepID=UPI0020042561|nr:hypothetical protein [Corynebacterium meridianum]MCK7677888.1 hypothetical protein [Corynebacterium meridianum]